MEEEGGRAAASSYSCPCDAIFRRWSLGRASSGTVLVASALPWVGERPVCVWGVLSSEILVQKPKQTKQFAVFLQKDFSRVSGNGNGYKKPPPKKKKSKLYLCISMYISIEGTLQEHCAVLISKSLPACVSYTFCIAVLFVLGEKN